MAGRKKITDCTRKKTYWISVEGCAEDELGSEQAVRMAALDGIEAARSEKRKENQKK